MKRPMAAAQPLATSCANAHAPTIGFLSRLGAADLRHLMVLGKRVQRLPHETLFVQGAPARKCFSIIKGVVCISQSTPDNRRQIVGFALPGDVMEIATQGHHHVSAVAIGPALVWEIASETFAEFAGHRPYVLSEMVALLADQIANAHEQMFSLGRRAAEEKLVIFLAAWRDRLAQRGIDVEPLPLPMSRRDIADFLGLTVETVCRALAKLERGGVIQILPGKVRLLDLPSV